MNNSQDNIIIFGLLCFGCFCFVFPGLYESLFNLITGYQLAHPKYMTEFICSLIGMPIILFFWTLVYSQAEQ